ncbi:MAG: glutathione peroxidase [Arcobacter sp.]|nr:glutathione peroxidase [Arcobacter sp.]
MGIYSFNVENIDGEDVSLLEYKNQVLLIVNVASKCGFTPQYEELEELYNKYKEYNFKILAFPSNQFLNQEPDSNHNIKEFCQLKYNISFDMFAKIKVNGKNESALFSYLKSQARGFMWTKEIKWNFTKFLVDENGKVIERYAPITKPKDMEPEIKRLLGI